MVKGITKQVIVVKTPVSGMFEQAIFILRDEAVTAGVTEEMLLKEAKRLIRTPGANRMKLSHIAGVVWAFGGAMFTAIVWVLTVLL